MTQMVRDREISPVELVESHLRQIRNCNPKINAFVTLMAEEALAAAKQAEAAVMSGESLGLLHGAPVTIKDSFDVAGLPTICGSKLRLGHRAAADATAVARLRAAGAIIIGKTNCPEFLSNYETDNYVTGRTNNPWDFERTPGGSSGGEAAAIAAFCSAGGIGSDGGGSIRIPAHFCGIAGLKPTPGRVPGTGHFPPINHPGGLLGVAGPMARSAQDVRLLFAALAGHDPQDPFSAPVPLRVPVIADLRVGVIEQFYQAPVLPVMKDVVRTAARALETIGIKVDAFQPAGLEQAPNLWWTLFGRVPAPVTRKLVEGHEAELHWTVTESLEAALAPPEPTVAEAVIAMGQRDELRAQLLRQMESVPLLLLPACGIPAFRHRERRWPVNGQEIGLFQAMMTVTPFNLLGMPAAVVPFGLADGLPVGVQLVGQPYCEELILEVAVRMEEVRGPFPGPELGARD